MGLIICNLKYLNIKKKSKGLLIIYVKELLQMIFFFEFLGGVLTKAQKSFFRGFKVRGKIVFFFFFSYLFIYFYCVQSNSDTQLLILKNWIAQNIMQGVDPVNQIDDSMQMKDHYIKILYYYT